MEAAPTADPELMANWPTASLSSNRRESSVNMETKSLYTEEKVTNRTQKETEEDETKVVRQNCFYCYLLDVQA